MAWISGIVAFHRSIAAIVTLARRIILMLWLRP